MKMKKIFPLILLLFLFFSFQLEASASTVPSPSNGVWNYSYRNGDSTVSGSIRVTKNEVLDTILSNDSSCELTEVWVIISTYKGRLKVLCSQWDLIGDWKFTFVPDKNDKNDNGSGSGSGSASGSDSGSGSSSGNGTGNGNGDDGGGTFKGGSGSNSPPPPPPPTPNPTPSTPPPTPTPTPSKDADSCALLHPETETPGTLLQVANLLSSVLPQTPDSMRLPTLIAQVGGQGSLGGNLALEIYSAAWQYFGIIAFIKFYKLIPGKMS